MFNKLTNDLIINIYEYDNTYNDKFNIVLEELRIKYCFKIATTKETHKIGLKGFYNYYDEDEEEANEINNKILFNYTKIKTIYNIINEKNNPLYKLIRQMFKHVKKKRLNKGRVYLLEDKATNTEFVIDL